MIAAFAARRRAGAACQNATPSTAAWRRRKAGPGINRTLVMDIERINAIGTTLQDLTERTEALRGYL
jgi:hypothetical protein